MGHCAVRRTQHSTTGPAGRSWPTASWNGSRVAARRRQRRSPSTWSSPTAHFSAATPRRRTSLATARFQPTLLADWYQTPYPIRGHARRCGGSTLILDPAHWWPWNHKHDVSRADWPHSSGYVTNDVAHRIATRRSDIATTPSRMPAAGRPPRLTGWECVNAATTSKRTPGGKSARTLTKMADTQRNTSLLPVGTTDQQRRR